VEGELNRRGLGSNNANGQGEPGLRGGGAGWPWWQHGRMAEGRTRFRGMTSQKAAVHGAVWLGWDSGVRAAAGSWLRQQWLDSDSAWNQLLLGMVLTEHGWANRWRRFKGAQAWAHPPTHPHTHTHTHTQRKFRGAVPLPTPCSHMVDPRAACRCWTLCGVLPRRLCGDCKQLTGRYRNAQQQAACGMPPDPHTHVGSGGGSGGRQHTLQRCARRRSGGAPVAAPFPMGLGRTVWHVGGRGGMRVEAAGPTQRRGGRRIRPRKQHAWLVARGTRAALCVRSEVCVGPHGNRMGAV
jgi:hypothetical protein